MKFLVNHLQYDVLFKNEKKSSTALIIPVLNEEERIFIQLEKLNKLSSEFDCIIVDGNSKSISEDSDRYKNAGVYCLCVNRGTAGQGSQLQIGLLESIRSNYQYFILMDGNNKDGVEGILSIKEKLLRGYDFVQGSRFIPGGISVNLPTIRYFGIRYIHAPLVSLFSGHKFTDTTNGFKGLSRNLVLSTNLDIFNPKFYSYAFQVNISINSPRLGFRCCEVPVTRLYPIGKVPTKIVGISGYISVLSSLFMVIFCSFRARLKI